MSIELILQKFVLTLTHDKLARLWLIIMNSGVEYVFCKYVKDINGIFWATANKKKKYFLINLTLYYTS